MTWSHEIAVFQKSIGHTDEKVKLNSERHLRDELQSSNFDSEFKDSGGTAISFDTDNPPVKEKQVSSDTSKLNHAEFDCSPIDRQSLKSVELLSDFHPTAETEIGSNKNFYDRFNSTAAKYVPKTSAPSYYSLVEKQSHSENNADYVNYLLDQS